VLARHLRDEVGRQLRRVGERLVVHIGELRDYFQRMPRLGIELGVLGPEVARHRGGILSLVVTALAEADRERAHRPRALGLHQRDDRG
jgi:hypothetical protein